MYALVIKGGTVVDPAQGIHARRDIGITQGKIASVSNSIPSSEAKKVVDARGKIVTPGLIDVHCHVAEGIFQRSVPADEAGVLAGVTAVCDAGSTGCANFADFRRNIIPKARTDIVCFLHLHSDGLAPVPPENWNWQSINPEAMLKTIEENRDIMRGVKLRAIGGMVQNLGVEGVRVAKKVAKDAGLPLMVHIGNEPDEPFPQTMEAFTIEMLSLLEKGDILSHFLTWKVGRVFKPDGSTIAGFKEARQRGVILDVAEARNHWDVDIARRAFEQGILPNTISTDLSNRSFNGPVFCLAVTMSKYLALGLTLEQVIAMTTINPARALGEEKIRGSLRIGMPANISILEVIDGDYSFNGGVEGKSLKGKQLLEPRLTIKNGVEIAARSRFK